MIVASRMYLVSSKPIHSTRVGKQIGLTTLKHCTFLVRHVSTSIGIFGTFIPRTLEAWQLLFVHLDWPIIFEPLTLVYSSKDGKSSSLTPKLKACLKLSNLNWPFTSSTSMLGWTICCSIPGARHHRSSRMTLELPTSLPLDSRPDRSDSKLSTSPFSCSLRTQRHTIYSPPTTSLLEEKLCSLVVSPWLWKS